jgi:hypothetical protein
MRQVICHQGSDAYRKRRYHLGNIGVDHKIILKLVLKK